MVVVAVFLQNVFVFDHELIHLIFSADRRVWACLTLPVLYSYLELTLDDLRSLSLLPAYNTSADLREKIGRGGTGRRRVEVAMMWQ